MRYAAEKRIPIHARGAGTGVAGESLGPGLVLDFSAHLRRVIRIDADRVRVQPGVVHERLNESLRPAGRLFGPDPATSAVTTDRRHDRHRRRRQPLAEVRLDAAPRAEPSSGVGRRRKSSNWAASRSSTARAPARIPRKRESVNRLATLLTDNAELIRQHQPEDAAEPLRVQSGRRARRRVSRRGAAVGRFRRNAGAGDRGHTGHRAAAAASGRGPAAVRQRREGGPRGARHPGPQPHGLRFDGPPPCESCARGRAAFRAVDPARDRGRRCWSSRTATIRWRCAAGSIVW